MVDLLTRFPRSDSILVSESICSIRNVSEIEISSNKVRFEQCENLKKQEAQHHYGCEIFSSDYLAPFWHLLECMSEMATLLEKR